MKLVLKDSGFEKKSLSVYMIAFSVIMANLMVLSVLYQVPFLSGMSVVEKVLPLISLLAVYPHELFQFYLKEDIWVHLYWILCVMVSAAGLMNFNRFARVVFISFNILQLVILGVVTVLHFGNQAFWGYFFKTYFNAAVFMLYVGYLTLPEIRQQFIVLDSRNSWGSWWLRFRKKTIPSSDGIGYFNLGQAYLKLGREDEALRLFQKAILILPGHVQTHFSMGGIYFARGDYPAAVKFFEETIRLDPIHWQARFCLGQTYQRTGCLEQALQSFRKCSFVNPPRGEVFHHLGIVCYEAGHWDEAYQAFLKACELDLQDHLSHFYLGLMAAKDPRYNLDAEERLKRAVKLRPDFVKGYWELGHYYITKGDYFSAVRAFRDVVRLDSCWTQAHYQLGFVYAMLKDFDSARREYHVLKDQDPDLAETLNLLLSRSGDENR